MNKNYILAIVAVVIIVAAGASYVVLSGGNDNDEPQKEFNLVTDLKEAKLAVLGNANGDTDIDNDDIAYIQKVIKNGAVSLQSNEETYNKEFRCDANFDKVIDSKDVDYVKSMMDGTCKVVYYESVDVGIAAFNVSEKIYLVPIHRTCGRPAALLSNGVDNTMVVGGSTEVATEAEFKDVIDQSKIVDVGKSGASTVSTELVSQLSSKYSDGSVVIMCGRGNSYCQDYEGKVGNAQIARQITWEGSALTGVLTWGYLFDGVGNPDHKAGTSWGQAKAYEAFWNKYVGAIEKYTDSLAEKDKPKVLCSYYDGTINDVKIPYNTTASTNTFRGQNTSDYQNSVLAGGNNVVSRFQSAETGWGNINWTLETVAQNCKDLDVIIFANSLYLGSSPSQFDEVGEAIAEGLTGFLPSTTKIYVKTYNLTGTPGVLDIVIFAKILCPDKFGNWDLEEVWNEYLDIYGADKVNSNLAFSNVGMCCTQPYYTTTSA
ncbi:MAG: hypothetical protein MJZ68_00740 [archaeon]|nr:hypothetical protein [archaeon]